MFVSFVHDFCFFPPPDLLAWTPLRRTAFGPHPASPHPSVPHPFGPHAAGPHPSGPTLGALTFSRSGLPPLRAPTPPGPTLPAPTLQGPGIRAEALHAHTFSGFGPLRSSFYHISHCVFFCAFFVVSIFCHVFFLNLSLFLFFLAFLHIFQNLCSFLKKKKTFFNFFKTQTPNPNPKLVSSLGRGGLLPPKPQTSLGFWARREGGATRTEKQKDGHTNQFEVAKYHERMIVVRGADLSQILFVDSRH